MKTNTTKGGWAQRFAEGAGDRHDDRDSRRPCAHGEDGSRLRCCLRICAATPGLRSGWRRHSIVPLLDEFFGVLAGATAMHGGRVFHMAGDGMMAGFGVGDPARSGAREALRAGHAMLQDFARVAARWRRELAVEAAVGVGLHLGEVALGSLGPPGRKADHTGRRHRQCRRETLQPRARRRGAAVLYRGRGAGAPRCGARRIRPHPIPVLQLPQFELRGRSAPLDIWCVPAADRLAF